MHSLVVLLELDDFVVHFRVVGLDLNEQVGNGLALLPNAGHQLLDVRLELGLTIWGSKK